MRSDLTERDSECCWHTERGLKIASSIAVKQRILNIGHDELLEHKVAS